MTTTITYYRASTRQFLFFTLQVVETVVSVDGVETVCHVAGIFPTAAAAQAYAHSISSAAVSE